MLSFLPIVMAEGSLSFGQNLPYSEKTERVETLKLKFYSQDQAQQIQNYLLSVRMKFEPAMRQLIQSDADLETKNRLIDRFESQFWAFGEKSDLHLWWPTLQWTNSTE